MHYWGGWITRLCLNKNLEIFADGHFVPFVLDFLQTQAAYVVFVCTRDTERIVRKVKRDSLRILHFAYLLAGGLHIFHKHPSCFVLPTRVVRTLVGFHDADTK